MTLLSREEVAAIRDRARRAREHGECEQLADDVGRLLQDLAASPPLVLIAPKGASGQEMTRAMRAAAKSHRGAVYVLPHGWAEADDEQSAVLMRRMRYVARMAREECAKVVERGERDEWPDGLPLLLAAAAADIRALNEEP